MTSWEGQDKRRRKKESCRFPPRKPPAENIIGLSCFARPAVLWGGTLLNRPWDWPCHGSLFQTYRGIDSPSPKKEENLLLVSEFGKSPNERVDHIVNDLSPVSI